MKKIIKKGPIKKILCIIVLVCTISPYINTFAGSTLVATYVPNTKQSQTYWCWAATGVAVLANRGKTVSQLDFARKVKGLQNPPNETASIAGVRSGLVQYGHSSTSGGALSTGTIRTQLSNGKPIIAGYIGNYVAHMVVICGHDSSDDYLQVMDPSNGVKVNYKTSYFNSNSKWYWNESIYNIN